jgi:4-hydroxy-tetrahydrodipicolinate synthase
MIEFSGVYTAMVTPFLDGKIDYDTLAKQIEFQVAGGVAGLVPVGTTGESPTLDYEEHMRVIEFTIEKVNGRCQVIAGTGGNSTREAVELTKKAKKLGADATLQVTPYYNKPTQEGLYRQHKNRVSLYDFLRQATPYCHSAREYRTKATQPREVSRGLSACR